MLNKVLLLILISTFFSFASAHCPECPVPLRNLAGTWHGGKLLLKIRLIDFDHAEVELVDGTGIEIARGFALVAAGGIVAHLQTLGGAEIKFDLEFDAVSQSLSLHGDDKDSLMGAEGLIFRRIESSLAINLKQRNNAAATLPQRFE